ncbi:Sec-independent protein translocase protein TatB [Jannaschia rubra]|uniref:Sec-independent protein translocase protein TatB n=1 Tax=Jannaschia rubra TaxID=282197 RepID=A0A0M6XVK9_9RHOB|nr:Sec-independent protein translocase protein TatB [Jannaschia rubra]CTQ34311.1 Sec-independent protein translocase protein TatB [Jannaschia rubra]SFG18210.1 sec-independent protein translocase protein TatB [Jannaschia rubra]
MFDIGWSELLVIGVVALIVVGPKDLPRLFRTLGEVTGKARRMAREFQNAMNDAADESGVSDITSDLRKMANPKKYGIDALKDATGELSAWSPDEPDGKPRASVAEQRAAAKERIAENTAARKARADADAADAAEMEDEPELLPDPAAEPPAEPAPAPGKPKTGTDA